MPTMTLGGQELEVDEDGFITDPDKWNDEVATDLAKTEAVDELTEDHWKIVNYLRNYYLEFGIAPMIRKLCKETGFKLKVIYELFPQARPRAPAKWPACPEPTGCV